MDRDFIARNQVVERYLSGRLPIKGATDFERFCRDHPELLDELGIPERVNAALRLLEASGKPEPWEEPRKFFWQKLEIVLGLLAATVVLAIALAIAASGSAQKTRRIAALQQEATERALDPATSTRDIHLLPSRDGASNSPAIIIGGGSDAELADFRIDESRSPYRLFRITIDRINQGRVGVIDHIAKDSDGNIRIALNSTRAGPGRLPAHHRGPELAGATAGRLLGNHRRAGRTVSSARPEVFVARQPIYDASMAVIGYELLYRASPVSRSARFGDAGSATLDVVAVAALEIGLDRLAGGLPVHINFPEELLVRLPDLPLQGQRVVIEVLEDVRANPQVLQGIRTLRARGHRIALDDYSPQSSDPPSARSGRYHRSWRSPTRPRTSLPAWRGSCVTPASSSSRRTSRAGKTSSVASRWDSPAFRATSCSSRRPSARAGCR